MNDISTNLIRIAIFALPGFAGTRTYRRILGRRNKADWETLYEILIFSILGYLLPLSLYPKATTTILMSIVQDAAQTNAFTHWSWQTSLIILLAVSTAFVAAYLAAAIDRTNIINRLAFIWRVSKRTNDVDAWESFHQTLSPPEAIIRCPSINRAYHGFIHRYSETGEPRELVLLNVTVYLESEGKPLYKWDKAYLQLDATDVIIQVGFHELPAAPHETGEMSDARKEPKPTNDK
ncbi:MAG: DUF6338 family protein [Phycisphaerae bacterium]